MKKKPPEQGFVTWDETTFERLKSSPPEKLESSFQMQHGMLLNVLSRREEDGCEEMRRLIRACHETPVKKQALRKRGFALLTTSSRDGSHHPLYESY